MSLKESLWQFLPPLRVDTPFASMPCGEAQDADVMLVRYVDDLLGLSSCLCVECLERMVLTMHKGIPFNAEFSTRDGAMPWLDMIIHAERAPPHIVLRLPERDFALGRTDAPTKFRIQPYLGREHFDASKLWSFIRGSWRAGARCGSRTARSPGQCFTRLFCFSVMITHPVLCYRRGRRRHETICTERSWKCFSRTSGGPAGTVHPSETSAKRNVLPCTVNWDYASHHGRSSYHSSWDAFSR